jgi:hypothetical protein
MKNQYILEPSSNTHVLHAGSVVTFKDFGNGVLKLNISGDGVVTHGEHNIIKTEAPVVLKYVQLELNPVTKMLQNVFD